jgi:hypothetical protein
LRKNSKHNDRSTEAQLSTTPITAPTTDPLLRPALKLHSTKTKKQQDKLNLKYGNRLQEEEKKRNSAPGYSQQRRKKMLSQALVLRRGSHELATKATRR